MRKYNQTFLIILSGIALFVFWTSFLFKVRFNSPYLNYFAVSFLLFILPISALIESLFVKGKMYKIIFGVCILVAAVPLYVGGGVAAFAGYEIYKDKRDPFKLQVDSVSNELGTFRLYQTNCGATCSFGLLLQREFDLPIGIKFTKEIWATENGTEGNGKILSGEHSIKIIENEKVLFELEG